MIKNQELKFIEGGTEFYDQLQFLTGLEEIRTANFSELDLSYNTNLKRLTIWNTEEGATVNLTNLTNLEFLDIASYANIEILDIREGGLSIHGAIIGGILAVIIIAKRSKIPFIELIDAIACSTILGQAIGRWGNYFNSEAYGYPTSMQNWGLFIPAERRVSEYANYELFHPTFLYESILDLTAFTILFCIYKNFGMKYKGLTLFSYFVIYALIRYFIEKMRVDSALNIGSLPIAELVSFILFAVGIIGIICILLKNRRIKD